VNIVAVIGNGASIPYNPRLALTPLTQEILSRFASQRIQAGDVQRTLSSLARAASPTGVGEDLSFEGLMGPIERIAQGLEAIRELARFVPEGENQRKRLKKVATFGRTLTRRAVGTTLQLVTELSSHEGEDAWDRGSALITSLADMTKPDGVLRVFSLNYDNLGDSALLRYEETHQGTGLSDMAWGGGGSRIQVFSDETRADFSAHPLRQDEEYLSPSNNHHLVLYHLHGSISWVRDGAGTSWKLSSTNRLRTDQLWSAYAKGETQIEPVVVLADQKAPRIARDPFEWAYRRLTRAVAKMDPDLIVIAGYGFGDDPLNRVLADALPDSTCPVVIITQTDDELRFMRRTLRTLPFSGAATRASVQNRTLVLGDGLPGAMSRSEWEHL